MLPVAIGDMNICYILDGILILYGLILTVLYCRLRITYMKSSDNHPKILVQMSGVRVTHPLNVQVWIVNNMLVCQLFSVRQKQPAEGGIYAGLTSHSTDTYEIIGVKKAVV